MQLIAMIITSKLQ